MSKKRIPELRNPTSSLDFQLRSYILRVSKLLSYQFNVILRSTFILRSL